MTKLFRIIAIVIVIVGMFGGTVVALEGTALEISVTDDNVTTEYTTRVATVDEFLKETNITLYSGDTIDRSMKYYLKDGDTITIDRAPVISVNVNDVPRIIRTEAQTVGEVVESLLSDKDSEYKIVGYDEKDKVVDGMKIELYLPTIVMTTEKVVIEHEVEYVEDDTMFIGDETTEVTGKNGVAVLTLKNMYLDGNLISSEELERNVTTEAVNTVIKKGTTIGTATNIDISALDYTDVFSVKTTGYTRYDAGCSGTTATGTVAQRGAIAVDPSFIPLGTKMYIPGYGIGIAEDTGGSIIGNKIDLCFDTVADALSWGVRTVEIYIIE